MQSLPSKSWIWLLLPKPYLSQSHLSTLTIILLMYFSYTIVIIFPYKRAYEQGEKQLTILFISIVLRLVKWITYTRCSVLPWIAFSIEWAKKKKIANEGKISFTSTPCHYINISRWALVLIYRIKIVDMN